MPAMLLLSVSGIFQRTKSTIFIFLYAAFCFYIAALLISIYLLRCWKIKGEIFWQKSDSVIFVGKSAVVLFCCDVAGWWMLRLKSHKVKFCRNENLENHHFSIQKWWIFDFCMLASCLWEELLFFSGIQFLRKVKICMPEIGIFMVCVSWICKKSRQLYCSSIQKLRKS